MSESPPTETNDAQVSSVAVPQHEQYDLIVQRPLNRVVLGMITPYWGVNF